MKTFRKILFWAHLITGVFVAAVVLIMSFTGVLLTYQRQITEWADTRGLDGGPLRAGTSRLSVDRLVAAARGSDDATPTSITWHNDPEAPVRVSFGRERTVFVNGYTAAVLGEGSKSVHGFFRFVTDWHRWLGAGGENRRIGRAVTGACNLGFLFIVLSGLYLWWPRNWSWKAVRSVLWFRRGLSPKARNFNWHNVIGFWSWLPLVIVVTSGVVISYPWASSLVYRLAGDTPPAAGGGPPGGPERGTGSDTPRPDTTTGTALSLDVLAARAEARMPGWHSLSLTLPEAGAETVSFSLDRGTGGEPQKRAQLVLDAATGREVKFEDFRTNTPGRRLRSILRFAHTGEVLGIFGQTVAGIVTLGTLFLVWTGLALSLRRFRSWRKRTATPTSAGHAVRG